MAATLGAGSPARADITGWTVLAEEDDTSKIVQMQIVIESGSLSDPSNLPGLAYYTGRAMLRGTFTRPYSELSNAIEQLGGTVSVDADLNTTTFRCAVLATNIDPFLDVLRDVFTQPAFNVTEMNTFQKILMGELQTELQDPQRLAARALSQAAYAGTAAEHPVKGSVVGVARIRPQDAQSFFHSHYVRENIVIGVTGPFARDSITTKIMYKLDAIPHGATDLRPIPAMVANGRHAIIVPRTGLSTVPVYAAVPGVGDNDPDMLALEVGNRVFGADFTSRLMQDLRVQHGWTYGAYSAYDQLIPVKREAGLFSEYFYPSTEYAALAIPEGVKLLEDYFTSGVTAAEFKGATDALTNGYPFAIDTADKRLALHLREALTGRPMLPVASYQAALGKLDLGAVNAAVARHSSSSNLVIAVVGDPNVLEPVLNPLVQTVDVVDIQP